MPALTSRRCMHTPPQCLPGVTTLRTRLPTPTQHEHRSRKAETNGSGGESDMPQAPEGERKGDKSLRFQPTARIGLFMRRRGRKRKLVCSSSLGLPFSPPLPPLLLKPPSLSFYQLLFFPSQFPPADLAPPLPPSITTTSMLLRAKGEIEPRDWVALLPLSPINRYGFHAACSNPKCVLASLPLGHVDTRVAEVKMRIFWDVSHNRLSGTMDCILESRVVSHQHFELPTHDQ